MLYALLCYNDEKVVWSWDRSQEDKVMAQLGEVRGAWVRLRMRGLSGWVERRHFISRSESTR